MARDLTVVELRCVDNPHRMFAKLWRSDDKPVISDNLLEFKCRDCGRTANATVLHRFNIAGELVETLVL